MNTTSQTQAQLALLRSRQTTQDFATTPVPEAITREALECAIRAPNHHLTNPWRFQLLGKRSIAAIANLNADLVAQKRGLEAAAKKRQRWEAIPGWLLVSCERDADPVRNRENYAACCCAIHSFCLALQAQGLGSKWTSGAVTRADGFADLVGMNPEREEFVGLIWFGYPSLNTPLSKRAPLEQVLRTRD
nr:nitroreductase [Oceanococcus sp. HetDA_MAG_MS8]